MLYGQSGSGKSWLYKKVLDSEDIPFVMSNLASAAIHGSIKQELRIRINQLLNQQSVTTTNAEIEIGIANIIRTSIGTNGQDAPILDPSGFLLGSISKFAKGKNLNREAIINEEPLMSELSNLILLLDDANYANHKV